MGTEIRPRVRNDFEGREWHSAFAIDYYPLRIITATWVRTSDAAILVTSRRTLRNAIEPYDEQVERNALEKGIDLHAYT